ncbi:superoxide dismutase [Mn], mitochondrial-like [Centruroides sculpturatus]|uniref:superoxide dismutase [Mn], mitochondrial-like n=1 Tax=Centruroides sculpturatus TaxID=218467 RepID=UPI000C6EDD03|nr:superoxide dismutase [Mn], mitochondrial-like [Centruroides sculpturatus]
MLSVRNITKFANRTKLLAAAGSQSVCFKHTLPDLPYDYGALEPIISAEIMRLHHQKHHAAYVNNLNIAEEKLAEAQAKSLIPLFGIDVWEHAYYLQYKNVRPDYVKAIWNVVNWKDVAQRYQELGDLLNAIKQCFGSLEELKTQMSAAAVGVQGSGWAWLGCCPKTRYLQIATCANQDPLQATRGLIPLFGIDVWEHAYYLQYKNVRPDYVKAIWNVVNWKDVAQRYQEVKK